MATIVKQRRDTAANWSATNPIIPDGQLVFDKTNNTFRIGDGVTAHDSLAIQSGVPGADGDVTQATLDAAVALKADNATTYNMTEVDNLIATNGDLGSLTKTFVAGEDATITMSSAVDTPNVTVTKEVVQTGVSTNDWTLNAYNFDVEDTAHDDTATPSGTSGVITITLGTGSWGAGDVSKVVTINSGKCIITEVAAGVATCTVDTLNQLSGTTVAASGEWVMNSMESTDDGLIPANVTSAYYELPTTLASAGAFSGHAAANANSILLSDGTIFTVGITTTTVYYSNLEIDGTIITPISSVTIATGALASDNPPIYARELDDGNIKVFYMVATSFAIYSIIISKVGVLIQNNTLVSNTIANSSDFYILDLVDGNFLVFGHASVAADIECVIISKVDGSIIRAFDLDNVAKEDIAIWESPEGLLYVYNRDDISTDVNMYREKIDVYDISSNISINYFPIQTIILSSSSSSVINGMTDLRLSYAYGYLFASRYYNGIIVIHKLNMSLEVIDTYSYLYDGTVTIQQLSLDAVNGELLLRHFDLTTHDFVIRHLDENFNVVSEYIDTTLTGADQIVNYNSFGDYVISNINGTNCNYYISKFSDTKEYFENIAAALPNTNTLTDTTYWTDVNSIAIDETINTQDAFYAYKVDLLTYYVTLDGVAPRAIVRDNVGTWEYNSNATYGSETWTIASSEYTALEDAVAVTVNQMTKAQADATTDAYHITLGSTIGLGVILNNTSGENYKLNDVDINYDANTLNSPAELFVDYTYDQPASDKIRINALKTNNLKVRVS